jgi:hypothetical protein
VLVTAGFVLLAEQGIASTLRLVLAGAASLLILALLVTAGPARPATGPRRPKPAPIPATDPDLAPTSRHAGGRDREEVAP